MTSYQDIQQSVEKLGSQIANRMDFEIWWTIARGDIIKEAELKFPLTGKVKNVFDLRTKTGKFIAAKKREAFNQRNN